MGDLSAVRVLWKAGMLDIAICSLLSLLNQSFLFISLIIESFHSVSLITGITLKNFPVQLILPVDLAITSIPCPPGIDQVAGIFRYRLFHEPQARP